MIIIIKTFETLHELGIKILIENTTGEPIK